jgi:hypothetical protein
MSVERRSTTRTARAARTDGGIGDEHCGFCLQSYAYELEVFCIHCDRPMCPVCVVTRTFQGERICPECASDTGSEEA